MTGTPSPGDLGPANADATRALRLKEITHGRVFGYALGLGMLGALAAAILAESLIVAVAGPVAVVVAVLAIAFAVADRRAAQDFFSAFAASHGFTYLRRYELMTFTPLLGAGDRRHCDRYMEGPLSAERHEVRCSLANYTFEVKHESRDADGDVDTTWDPHHFTICTADLEAGMGLYPGVFLAPRRGFISKMGEGNWLRGRNFRKVELESSQFAERYDLFIDPALDELRLRELFSPSFIAWLSGHPIEPCFEYKAGMLVVYVSGHTEDGGHLQWLLDASRDIVKRFEAEIGEESRSAA